MRTMKANAMQADAGESESGCCSRLELYERMQMRAGVDDGCGAGEVASFV